MAAAAAAAAVPPRGPDTATMARTYLDKYTQDTDVLEGDYTSFYNRYAATLPEEQVVKHVIGSSMVLPKVFLYLATADGKPTISAFHRPSTYQAHPTPEYKCQ